MDLVYESKVRWFVIVSRQDDEALRALALGVAVTTNYRGSPYEVRLGKLACLREESCANTQGLTALRWCDFLTLGGQVSPPLL